MQQGLRDLAALSEEYKDIQRELSLSEGERADTLENTEKKEQQIKKAIIDQVKHMKQLQKTSASYADNVLKASEGVSVRRHYR